MQMKNAKEFYQTNKKRGLNLSTLEKGSPCSWIVAYYVLLAILNFRALQEREVSKEIVEKLVVLWVYGCRISSVGRSLDGREGGRRFDSRNRTHTEGL